MSESQRVEFPMSRVFILSVCTYAIVESESPNIDYPHGASVAAIRTNVCAYIRGRRRRQPEIPLRRERNVSWIEIFCLCLCSFVKLGYFIIIYNYLEKFIFSK